MREVWHLSRAVLRNRGDSGHSHGKHSFHSRCLLRKLDYFSLETPWKVVFRWRGAALKAEANMGGNACASIYAKNIEFIRFSPVVITRRALRMPGLFAFFGGPTALRDIKISALFGGWHSAKNHDQLKSPRNHCWVQILRPEKKNSKIPKTNCLIPNCDRKLFASIRSHPSGSVTFAWSTRALIECAHRKSWEYWKWLQFAKPRPTWLKLAAAEQCQENKTL